MFLRDILGGYLSLKDSDGVQSNFTAKIENLDKNRKTIEKSFFKINLWLLFSAREKAQKFKSRVFSIKNLVKIATRESTTELATEPTKHKKLKLKSKLKLKI